MSMKLMERGAIWLTGLIVCAALYGVAILFGLAQIHPYRPRTVIGWELFVVAVPLAWILSDGFGEVLDKEPAGRWVDRRTADKQFSWVRVSYLLVRTLLVVAAVVLTIWLVSTYLPALRDLVTRHFGPAA